MSDGGGLHVQMELMLYIQEEQQVVGIVKQVGPLTIIVFLIVLSTYLRIPLTLGWHNCMEWSMR